MPLHNYTEARYFEIFQTQASHELAGAFHLNLWDRLVLQAARDEPFARHAVIALGALNLAYKSDPRREFSGLQVNPNDPHDHYTFALVQYDKALRHMRKAVTDIDDDLWKALLSCLLVYCFESFYGRRDIALSTARNGQKLLQDRLDIARTKFSQGDVHTKTPVVESDIIHGMSRLDLLMVTTSDARSVSEHRNFEDKEFVSYPKLPKVFTTLDDAKFHFEIIMRNISHFVASSVVNSPMKDGWPSDINDPQTHGSSYTCIYAYYSRMIHSKYHDQHAAHTAELQQWCAAFEPLSQEYSILHEKTAMWYGMARLQVHSRAIKIVLASTLSNSQMIYDQFLPDFKAIVTYALPVLYAETKTPHPRFHFDISLTPPVLLTALCCRDWKVRRQALGILKMPTPQREVYWNKDMAAAQVSCVMEIEENGLGFREFIPDANRVTIIDANPGEAQKSVNMCFLVKRDAKDVIIQRIVRW